MDNSPFARLSPELRNNIYELALHNSDGDIELDSLGCSNQLTRTCRQIRIETRAMFYAANEFRVTLLGSICGFPVGRSCKTADLLETLLHRLGPELVGRIPYLNVAIHDTSSRNVYSLKALRKCPTADAMIEKLPGLVGGIMWKRLPDFGEWGKDEGTWGFPERVYQLYQRLGLGALVIEEFCLSNGWRSVEFSALPLGTAS